MTIHCAFEGVMMQSRVEVSITDHLRDFVSDMENYKAVQVFPCWKIEIKRIAVFSVILFLKLKLL
jgi:hypothetical protein